VKHFILFDNIKNLTINQLIDVIKSCEKKRFEELNLIDLIYEKHSYTGVYVIFDENDIAVYVGKSSSRAILERISSHLDFRTGVPMNTFLRKLVIRANPEIKNIDRHELAKVHDLAFQHKLAFVEIPNWGDSKRLIPIVESALSHSFSTKLNSRRSKQSRILLNVPICDIISSK